MQSMEDGMSGFSPKVDRDFSFLNILWCSKLTWRSYLLSLPQIDGYVYIRDKDKNIQDT